jgi:hypothetical protein
MGKFSGIQREYINIPQHEEETNATVSRQRKNTINNQLCTIAIAADGSVMRVI